MRHRRGVTLMEIIIVLVIIGIFVAMFLPNFTTPTEHARAGTVQNNLLAIYSAQKNYSNNNNGIFASLATLALIDSTLSLNIQDDGTYLYSCVTTDPSGFACTAQRNISPTPLTLKVTNTPIQLGGVNPSCTPAAGYSAWCP